MWAFFDFGLLMPALVPASVKDNADVLEWTNNGEYELQVRGRLSEHLQYFMDTYMEPGTFNPEIHKTPDMDYNFRFYTTREAYAEGIKQAALAMDYEKFKVTSERYSWNTKYHSILNSIWGKLCELNQPGGFYGPRSEDNPRGYLPGRKYSSYGFGSEEGWYDRKHTEVNRRVGSTFGIEDMDSNIVVDEDDDSIDYVSESEREMYKIIDELDEMGISPAEWGEYLSPHEFEVVSPILKSQFGKKVFRAIKRRNRQAWEGQYAQSS
jgi:hypothetical protein